MQTDKLSKQEWESRFLKDEAATFAFGHEVAKHVHTGMILNLLGDLGAGKTSFCKGLVESLGGRKEDVQSPTFNLVHEYDCGQNFIVHCDFCRLPFGDRLEDFGALEFFEQDAIFLGEWLEQTGIIKEIPSERLHTFRFEYEDMHRRVFFAKNFFSNRAK